MEKKKESIWRRSIRMVFYIIGWLIFTVGVPLLPVFLAIWFKSIVGYTPTIKDYAPDIILAVVGIIASSIWTTMWSEKLFSKEFRVVIIGAQLFLTAAGYAIYFSLFGEFTLPDVLNSNPAAPQIILRICFIALAVNTTWNIITEVRARIKVQAEAQNDEPSE